MKKQTSLSMYFAMLVIASLACSLPGQGSAGVPSANPNPSPTVVPTATIPAALSPETVVTKFLTTVFVGQDVTPYLSPAAATVGIDFCNYLGLKKIRECYLQFVDIGFDTAQVPLQKNYQTLTVMGTVVIARAETMVTIIARLGKQGLAQTFCHTFWVTRVDAGSPWGVNYWGPAVAPCAS